MHEIIFPSRGCKYICHDDAQHQIGVEVKLRQKLRPCRYIFATGVKRNDTRNSVLTYDWENQFKAFQDLTLKGAFKAQCQNEESSVSNISSTFISWPANITEVFEAPNCAQ
ncbi:unnamed protein product [Ceratitis capitata]|uniref:(Mediterranean fruit fly) hypothetical protein n=1 Tax=Ceratitis capitata TaxID=7213 RepID=A0A811UXC9_CERCA|nr:unnamed protein product [Ceratitis capitata]